MAWWLLGTIFCICVLFNVVRLSLAMLFLSFVKRRRRGLDYFSVHSSLSLFFFSFSRYLFLSRSRALFLYLTLSLSVCLCLSIYLSLCCSPLSSISNSLLLSLSLDLSLSLPPLSLFSVSLSFSFFLSLSLSWSSYLWILLRTPLLFFSLPGGVLLQSWTLFVCMYFNFPNQSL